MYVLSKNKKINSEKVEQQLCNLNVTTSKIEQRIQSLKLFDIRNVYMYIYTHTHTLRMSK